VICGEIWWNCEDELCVMCGGEVVEL